MRSSAGKSAKKGERATPQRGFERELAMLEGMHGRELAAEDVEQLRKLLGASNNFVVSKAAKRVADAGLTQLMAEVLAAYGRFFADPVKSDPQCWAKTELAKALVKFECQDAEVFIRGMRHVQEEPVWGGQSDTAGALRAACTHALVACHSLSNARLLDLLLEPLVDKDKIVRMEAARAIGHAGGMSAALVLKLRVMVGRDEPEVMGACFSALLAMDADEHAPAIALVAGFLDKDDDEVAGEAAFALAETHVQAALAALIARRQKGASSWLYSVLDHAIALTRLAEGVDFLLALLERDPRHAESVLEAISRVHSSDEVREQVKAAVARADSSRASQAYWQFFPGELG
ncbi:MAG TPA: HEAT repeat domain-containing protein [Acidobacteriaceae bacterium]